MKKMSLFSLICLAVGSIIGSGIFGSLPSAVNLVGGGIVYATIVAGIIMILKILPSMVPNGVFPCRAAYYIHLTRLVNPYVGWLYMVKLFFNIFVLALLSSVFSTYFNMLIPCNKVILEVAILAICGIISYFGVSAGTKVQNILVIAMFAALAVFIFGGFANLDPQIISFESVVAPKGFNMVSFGAAVGLMSSCLNGGDTCVNYGSDLKNPKRDVLLGFILSTLIAAVVYCFMGVVGVGVIDPASVSNLANIAAVFMSKPLYVFFICCGALFAIVTSVNGVMLATIYQFSEVAKDRVFPDFMAKQNKHGIATGAVVLVAGVGILIAACQLSIMTLVSVSSVLGVFISLCQFLPALNLHKRFPHSYKNSAVKISFSALIAIMIVALALCIWQSWSTIVNAGGKIWLVLLCVLAACYVYFFIRKAYLAKKGVDMVALMSRIPEDWINKEAEFAKKDAE